MEQSIIVQGVEPMNKKLKQCKITLIPFLWVIISIDGWFFIIIIIFYLSPYEQKLIQELFKEQSL